MRAFKIRSGVNWQVAFKQNGVKQTGVRQGLGVVIKKRLLKICAFLFFDYHM
jgi:hypothetical protein